MDATRHLVKSSHEGVKSNHMSNPLNIYRADKKNIIYCVRFNESRINLFNCQANMKCILIICFKSFQLMY